MHGDRREQAIGDHGLDEEGHGAQLPGELLRTRVGEGFTGWVAKHGVPLLIGDANLDPRGATIPGTDDVDESMLVVPMIHDDTLVGVITLSKLGLRRFDEDDLRLLTILATSIRSRDVGRLDRLGIRDVAAMLFIFDPARPLDIPAERIMDAYGLTLAEARVALCAISFERRTCCATSAMLAASSSAEEAAVCMLAEACSDAADTPVARP